MLGCSGFGSLVILDAQRWDGDKRSLPSLPVAAKATCPNQMFHEAVGWTFYRVFGAPANSYPAPDGAIWAPVWFSKTGYQTFYDATEIGTSNYVNVASAAMEGIVVAGTSDHNWFAMALPDQEMEPHLIWSEDFVAGEVGLRAIYRSVRFFWNKDQVVSDEIRSIYFGMANSGNGWSTAWDGYGNAWVRAFARIRLLDSGGQPATYSKTADQVAVLEYTMRLVSL